MPKPNTKLIVILGPTSSGKTGWAFKLCQEFNGEIISADSRQIYREMDIGTNKFIKSKVHKVKSPEIREHLIDIVNPDKTLTLSQYKKLAIKTINDILNRGKVPFLVGGTGLYISAIVDNLEIPEVKPDWELRKYLEKKDLENLQKDLQTLDPIAYNKIDLNNKRRLIRALEVCKITGKSFSSLQKKGTPFFDTLQIGIDISKEELHKKINFRVDKMKKAGLEQEVQKLAQKYSWNLPSMSGIGYREFNISRNAKFCVSTEKIFDEIKKHTQQYAKRQMTWFRRDKRIIWTTDYKKAEEKIKDFLV